MRRRLAVLFGSLVALVAAWFVGSGAMFSSAGVADVEWLNPTRLTAVTVDVEVGAGSVRLAVDNMAPGDRAVASLDVVNVGTVPLRYSLVAEASDPDMGDHFRLDVWPRTGECEEDGTELLATGGPSGGVSNPLLGDPATGRQRGDRILDVDDADELCFSVTLDRDAPNEVQGQALTQILTVMAEHDVEAS